MTRKQKKGSAIPLTRTEKTPFTSDDIELIEYWDRPPGSYPAYRSYDKIYKYLLCKKGIVRLTSSDWYLELRYGGFNFPDWQVELLQKALQAYLWPKNWAFGSGYRPPSVTKKEIRSIKKEIKTIEIYNERLEPARLAKRLILKQKGLIIRYF